MRQHTILISLLLLASVALVCCTKGGIDPAVTEGEMVDYGFYMSGTKAGSPDSTTYRAMLHNNHGDHKYTGISGTYRATGSEKAWLIPCNVDAKGVWNEDSHAAGLRATKNKYYISFVSPAVEPEKYNNGSEWGLCMYRDSSVHPNLYVSSQVLIDSLKGNYLKNTAVYDFSASVLKQRKSRIDVVIKNETASSIRVDEVRLENCYDTCYFNLRQNVVDFASFSRHYQAFYKPTSGTTLSAGGSLNVGTVAVFSYNYSTNSSTAPEIGISLGSGGPRNVSIAKNFAPMTKYVCTITFTESGDQTVTVSADGWTEHFGISGEISD